MGIGFNVVFILCIDFGFVFDYVFCWGLVWLFGFVFYCIGFWFVKIVLVDGYVVMYCCVVFFDVVEVLGYGIDMDIVWY